MLSEDQFSLFENIKIKLNGQNGNEIEFVQNSRNFLITNERLLWVQFGINKEQIINEYAKKRYKQKNKQYIVYFQFVQKVFLFNYETLYSHSQKGDQFMCFFRFSRREEIYLEEEQEALIEQQNLVEIVNLGKGEYQIYFDLSKYSNETKNKQMIIYRIKNSKCRRGR